MLWKLSFPFVISTKTFHATRALRDVSLDFMSGEVHCLAGQNGCGKSTLIKIMSGVYRPDEGAEITLGGKTGQS